MKLYMFWVVLLSIIRSFIHCALSNGICHIGLNLAFEQNHFWTCFKANKLHSSDAGEFSINSLPQSPTVNINVSVPIKYFEPKIQGYINRDDYGRQFPPLSFELLRWIRFKLCISECGIIFLIKKTNSQLGFRK